MRFPFRVPLYSQCKVRSTINAKALNQTVPGCGLNGDTLGQAIDTLPMQAIDDLFQRIGNTGQHTTFAQIDRMGRSLLAIEILCGILKMMIKSGLLVDFLMQRATQSYVDFL